MIYYITYGVLLLISSTQGLECGGFLADEYGYFESPGFTPGLPYPNNLDCFWVIKLEPDQRVKLVFLNFDIEDDENCGYDFVQVFNGASVFHDKIMKRCGSVVPDKLELSGHEALLWFHSDGETSARGFRATYQPSRMVSPPIYIPTPKTMYTTTPTTTTTTQILLNPMGYSKNANKQKHVLHRCSDGQVVLSSWLCDGVPDCQDGADERPESAGCQQPSLTAWNASSMTSSCSPEVCARLLCESDSNRTDQQCTRSCIDNNFLLCNEGGNVDNACFNITCENGGTCHQGNHGEQYCFCLPGYYGNTCELRFESSANRSLHLHVSEQEGVDIADCGLTQELPCKTITYALGKSFGSDQNDTFTIQIPATDTTQVISGHFVVSSPVIFNSSGHSTNVKMNLVLRGPNTRRVAPPVLFRGLRVSGIISAENVPIEFQEASITQMNLTIKNGNVNLMDNSVTHSIININNGYASQDIKKYGINIEDGRMENVSVKIFGNSDTQMKFEGLNFEQSLLDIKISEEIERVAKTEPESTISKERKDRSRGKRETTSQSQSENVIISDAVFDKSPEESSKSFISIDTKSKFDIALRNVQFRNGHRGLQFKQKDKISNIIIEKCGFYNHTAGGSGGGVNIEHEHGEIIVRIDHCEFKNNQADDLTAENGNIVRGQGGAVSVAGDNQGTAILEIHKSTFSDNAASDKGGSLYLSSSVTSFISDSAFTSVAPIRGNIVDVGGTTYVVDSKLTCLQPTQWSLLHFDGVGNDDFFIISNMSVSCPGGSSVALRSVEVGKYGHKTVLRSIALRCEPCPDGKYSFKDVESSKALDMDVIGQQFGSQLSTCLPCPTGAKCANSEVKVVRNHWGHQHGQRVYPHKCPKQYCCGQDLCKLNKTCAPHRRGTLCGHCTDGYTESIISTSCVPNTQCSTLTVAWIWTSMFSYMILVIIALTFCPDILIYFMKLLTCHLCRKRSMSSNMRRDRRTRFTSIAYTVVFILIDFYQTILILQRLKQGENNSIIYQRNSWQETILSHIKYVLHPIISVISVDVFDLPVDACLFTDIQPPVKYMIRLGFYCCLMLVFCLFYICTVCVTLSYRDPPGNLENASQTQRRLNSKFARTFILLCVLEYMHYADITLSLLHCEPIKPQGQYVLFVDGNTPCFQDWQYGLVAVIVIYLAPFIVVHMTSPYLLQRRAIRPREVLWGNLCPLFYLLRLPCLPRALCAARAPEEEHGDSGEGLPATLQDENDVISQALLHLLWLPYKKYKRCKLSWTAWIITRKLLLISISIFVADAFILRISVFTVVLSMLLLQFIIQPFKNRILNSLENLSLLISTFMALHLLLQQFSEDSVSFAVFILVLEWSYLLLIVLSLSTVCLITIFVIISAICVCSCSKSCTEDDHSKDQEQILAVSHL